MWKTPLLYVIIGHLCAWIVSAPTEASFFITWDPDPLEKGKDVIIEGNYTFRK